MDRLRKAGILINLVERLHAAGSWCGETHIQKAMFLLQEVGRVLTEFEFVLYKHGPFSFDLRDELTSLRADELLELRSQPAPYGPRYAPTELGKQLPGTFVKTLSQHERARGFVAQIAGGRGVANLERLATALYVTRRTAPGAAAGERAEQLCRLKPHIAPADAQAAITEVDALLSPAA